MKKENKYWLCLMIEPIVVCTLGFICHFFIIDFDKHPILIPIYVTILIVGFMVSTILINNKEWKDYKKEHPTRKSVYLDKGIQLNISKDGVAELFNNGKLLFPLEEADGTKIGDINITFTEPDCVGTKEE